MSNGGFIILSIGFVLLLCGIGSVLFGLNIETGDETTPEGKAMGVPRDFFIGLGILLIVIGIVLIGVSLLMLGRH